VKEIWFNHFPDGYSIPESNMSSTHKIFTHNGLLTSDVLYTVLGTGLFKVCLNQIHFHSVAYYKKNKNSGILNILCLICFTKALVIGAFS